MKVKETRKESTRHTLLDILDLVANGREELVNLHDIIRTLPCNDSDLRGGAGALGDVHDDFDSDLYINCICICICMLYDVEVNA